MCALSSAIQSDRHLELKDATNAVLCNLQDQLSSCMGMYVEEVLSGHFQLLLNHVQKAEHARKAQASR